MISLRRARPADAPAIGAVHVAAWRSTYPGILPDAYLSSLSVTRQAAHYDAAIRAGAGVYVATASGLDLPGGVGSRVVGFTTAGRARIGGLGEGEIETLYVLDDWRERGLGRRLMRAAAGHLAAGGCRSAFLWVLSENPSRWFYLRLGGKAAAEGTVRVAGHALAQTAYIWDPIEKLLAASPAG
ncbi:MAG TPA: GNAT family N-acetyltransferase [Acetobacteraceae bacterium]|nr:GNAT family N-acetyltransferase [Acetobacteraceae bacterium]